MNFFSEIESCVTEIQYQVTRRRHFKKIQTKGGPNSLHERGRDSCLRAVLCYKRLFTKACMGSIGFS